MDATSFLDEASVGLLSAAVVMSIPAVVGAALNLGCGKKRAPVKPAGKSKKGVAGKSSKSSKAGGVSKSKKGKAGSGSSKSGKSGKAGGALSKRSKSSKSKSGKSGKGSSKSKKGSKGKKSSGSSSKQLKGGKQESSLKERSTQSSSAKVVSAKTAAPIAPASGAAPASQQGAIEAERASARAAHVAAAQGVDASLKSAKTQTVSIKEPQGTPTPPSLKKASMPRDPPEPLVPLEVQLLPQFYAGELLLLPPPPSTKTNTTAPADSGGIGIRLQVPRTLLDSAKEIKMEPAELRWSSTGGMQKISLVNQTAERQAIKVKCSDNNVYRVNPVYAFVEPGQTLNVDVMRQNGSNKVDKIVFVTAKAPVEEANPKVLFKPGAPSSMMVLPLLATAQNEPPAVAAVN
uniref:Major sperm protein n=1 Tax=Panagrellus redivivus TaxID=6233 RepID=A0A7E4W0H8_PANRE